MKRLLAFLSALACVTAMTACSFTRSDTDFSSRSDDSSRSDSSSRTSRDSSTSDDESSSSRTDDSSSSAAADDDDEGLTPAEDDTWSALLNQSYYYADSHENVGDFYWVYTFDFDGVTGRYSSEGRYADGSVVPGLKGEPWELMSSGSFTVERDGTVNMLEEMYLGPTNHNYLVSNREFTITLNSDGTLSDTLGYTYFPGKPWPDQSLLDEPVVIATSDEWENWYVWIDYDNGAEGDWYAYTDDDGTEGLFVTIDDPGPDPWSVQAKFENLTLEYGSTYHVSFYYQLWTPPWITSGYTPSEHTASFAIQHNGGEYETYHEENIPVSGHTEGFNHVDTTFVMTGSTDTNAFLGINAGGIGNINATLTVKNLVIEKLS